MLLGYFLMTHVLLQNVCISVPNMTALVVGCGGLFHTGAFLGSRNCFFPFAFKTKMCQVFPNVASPISYQFPLNLSTK